MQLPAPEPAPAAVLAGPAAVVAVAAARLATGPAVGLLAAGPGRVDFGLLVVGLVGSGQLPTVPAACTAPRWGT